MVINIDSLGFTANTYSDADASLPALLLLLTIEIQTSLLHFIHQLLRRRKIELILTGDNRLVIVLLSPCAGRKSASSSFTVPN